MALSTTSASQAETPTTTPKPKVVKRQLHPWQQMSALNTIQRQLQHLNDQIEESHATLDSLESFTRNQNKLKHQLRTIREDLILLKRTLAWLARYTRTLTPNNYVRNDDFSFHPEFFDDVSERNSEGDYEPAAEGEDFPPFQERMLRTKAYFPPRMEENRTIFEKDVEEEKQITDEEIAFALPSNVATSFKENAQPDAKASDSFQMSSFLLPPMRNRNAGMRYMKESFGFLPNFEVYRKFKDLSEVPLERHSFFDTPKSFRRSHSSFEAPLI